MKKQAIYLALLTILFAVGSTAWAVEPQECTADPISQSVPAGFSQAELTENDALSQRIDVSHVTAGRRVSQSDSIRYMFYAGIVIGVLILAGGS